MNPHWFSYCTDSSLVSKYLHKEISTKIYPWPTPVHNSMKGFKVNKNEIKINQLQFSDYIMLHQI